MRRSSLTHILLMIGILSYIAPYGILTQVILLHFSRFRRSIVHPGGCVTSFLFHSALHSHHRLRRHWDFVHIRIWIPIVLDNSHCWGQWVSRVGHHSSLTVVGIWYTIGDVTISHWVVLFMRPVPLFPFLLPWESCPFFSGSHIFSLISPLRLGDSVISWHRDGFCCWMEYPLSWSLWSHWRNFFVYYVDRDGLY